MLEGQLFSLCFVLALLFTPPPKGGGVGYRHSWVRQVCPACPQAAHVGPTAPVWGFAGVIGVISLLGSQNRIRGLHGLFAFPLILAQPFHYEERLVCHLNLLQRISMNSPTTRPHGFNGVGNRSFWCRFLTWSSKPHTGPHGAEFGSHRFSLGRFCSGKAAKSFSSL